MSNVNRIHQLAIENNEKIQTTYTINDASDPDAFAYGVNVDAIKPGQTALGRYPDKTNMDDKLLIIGNGNEANSSNAHTLDDEGNAWYAGTLTAMDNIYIQNADNTLSAVATKQDIIASKTTLTISKNKGQLILKAYGLDPSKSYSIKALTRSRHNRSHTGEWRELDGNYGYAILAGKTRATIDDDNTEITFPEVPTWMPQKGLLQSTWTDIKYNDQYKCHLLTIDPTVWLLDLLKPLLIENVTPPEAFSELSNKSDYYFSNSSIPAAAMLIGLQASCGYSGLPFKFRLYDENNQIMAETNEAIYISGHVMNKETDILYSKRQTNAIVYITTDEQNQIKLDNLFIKIV